MRGSFERNSKRNLPVEIASHTTHTLAYTLTHTLRNPAICTWYLHVVGVPPERILLGVG